MTYAESMNKSLIIKAIISHIEEELDRAIIAANEARSAAIDDESVAETQYDTLAIEASYLAEGQSKRVQSFQNAIEHYQQMQLKNYDQDTPINLGALVQIAHDQEKNHWFFIGPDGGGFRCQIGDKHITLVTPQSPIGKAFMGKYLDDEIALTIGQTKVTNTIIAIC